MDTTRAQRWTESATCRLCGCWQGTLGNEPTVAQFIANLAEVFREIWRVLRDDGVCWVNIGDTMGGGGSTTEASNDNRRFAGSSTLASPCTDGQSSRPVKPRDNAGNLLGIPGKLRDALQAEGWTVRAEIVWAKGASFAGGWNGSVMPSSVAGWRWERHRVRIGGRTSPEEAEDGWHEPAPDGKPRTQRPVPHPERPQNQGYSQAGGHRDHPHGGVEAAPGPGWIDCPGCPVCEPNDGLVLRRGSWRPTAAHEMVFMLSKGMGYYADGEAVREGFADERMGCDGATQASERNRGGRDDGFTTPNGIDPSANGGRNLRDVWAINPGGGADSAETSHYAAFPAALVLPMLRSTCPLYICQTCGEPWARVIESKFVPQEDVAAAKGIRGADGQKQLDASNGWNGVPRGSTHRDTLGWRPTCTCPGSGAGGQPLPCLDTLPGIALDPFAGSGTVGAVALQLGLRTIGIEASRQYAEKLAIPRLQQADTTTKLPATNVTRRPSRKPATGQLALFD